ncbi:GDSL-type esterase/lipase family protein [Leifsonia sp. 71-9]|uniref:GDSL-type esterase/lipase family protein n=1 Tax=Leifsonia sp. 71-9 TaxID=1895934 RepID=UPI00092BD6D9|nr:GDSL-type esterase/lipase family protein [Leifsonia sp. 71-9]OJX80358.1 MAG: hypothetical protein BGO91_08715 [Leifsonia sp. 71-9]
MDAERVTLGRRLLTRAQLLRVVGVRTGLARPADFPQGFVAGRRSARVLLVGSGPVVGWGVASYDLALPGALARALAASTGRGSVVDVVAHPSAGVRRLRSLVAAAGPERYDVVVLSATLADSLRLPNPERWGRRVRSLLREVQAARGGEGTVVWLGAQPIRAFAPDDEGPTRIAQEHAGLLNDVAERVCREEGALFVALPAPPHAESTRHRGPADYLFWARRIADVLAPALREQNVEPPSPRSTQERVEAIERLRLGERGRDARLDGLVGTAQRTLGTEIAMFTVLGAEKEWALAAVGTATREFPLEQSACQYTIASADGMVVPDAELDERFATSSVVTGPAHLRYYAGYPVEAPDGTRIGALCVFGRAPRDVETGELDLDVLRELALLAQRELWRWEPDRV